MKYRIDVINDSGLRVASFDDVPLFETIRTAPDQPDHVRGLLPPAIQGLGPGWRVRVFVGDRLFCDAEVLDTAPQWSETRKLILDKYVTFRELVAFSAQAPARMGNTRVRRAYQNRTISAIVRDAINAALGPIHYTVDHTAYPDGAAREFQKFETRRTDTNELEIGGITQGQWVGADRIDATEAFAKDGDTIAGLQVDGAPWPDLRFMMIDAEETSLNSHAKKVHPETAHWTAERYNRSGYKVRADAATDFLQHLIDTKGIDYIELNPHRDASGQFDDRVDAFGRYIGLVFGGGECFNAALVEQDLADVYLYQDGRFHVPEMALKDFFSYRRPAADSIEDTDATLAEFDVDSGVLEVITALAYAAGGFIWSLSPEGAVTFREAKRADRVTFFAQHRVGITYGSAAQSVANFVVIKGSPETGTLDKAYLRGESADRFRLRVRFLDYFSIHREDDADRIAAGLLDDLAYPEPVGEAVYFEGVAHVQPGDLMEFRDGGLRRLDPALADEWGQRFTDRLVARVKEVSHRFTGRRLRTALRFTSPLRSVDNPVSFITRSQPPARSLFQFRLDEDAVGLDLGYHLD